MNRASHGSIEAGIEYAEHIGSPADFQEESGTMGGKGSKGQDVNYGDTILNSCTLYVDDLSNHGTYSMVCGP